MVNSSLTVLEGSTLALHCSTQGSPAPTLTWLKDGELVGTIVADELSVLEVFEVTPQGAGQYRCLAENEHGRASSSLNVTVECESGVPPLCSPGAPLLAFWGVCRHIAGAPPPELFDLGTNLT